MVFRGKSVGKKFIRFVHLLLSERDIALKLRRSSSPSRSQGLSGADSPCKFLIVCNQKKKKKNAHLSPRKEKEYKDEEDEETYASAVVLVVPIGVSSSRVGCVCGVIPVKETAVVAVGVRTAADSR